MQKTNGIRSFLGVAKVYDLVQFFFKNQGMIDEVLKNLDLKPGQKLLDIGSGTSWVLSHLKEGVDYYGFDISEKYIRQAKDQYGSKGNFYCQKVTANSLKNIGKFDAVLMTGVLHHLSDKEIKETFILMKQFLKEGGRVVCTDPCLRQGHPANFIIKLDRGQNIKYQEGYTCIAKEEFGSVACILFEKKIPPYSWNLMTLKKG